MQSKSWALAAAFALALSGASAEPSRPRIYYPRQVKRQLDNGADLEAAKAKRGLFDDLLNLGGDDSTDTATVTAKPTKEGILLGPTGIVIPGLIGDDDDETTTTTTKKHNGTSTEEPTSTSTSKGGLFDPVFSTIFGSDSTTTEEPSKTKETAKPKPTTTSKGGLFDPLPTLISDIFNSDKSTTTPEPSANYTTTASPTSTSDGNIITEILPSLTLFPPEPTTTPGSLPVTTPGSGVPTPTDGPINSTTIEFPEPPTSTPTVPTNTPDLPPPVNSTAEPTELPTELPTTPISLPPTSEPTPIPTTATPSTPSTVIVPSSSTEVVVPVPVPTTSEKTKVPVTSIVPTATYSNSEDWMPTSIVVAPSSFTFQPTDEPTGTTVEDLPTDIPRVILSNDPDKSIPEGSVQIQIGFDYALNYNHVAKNPIAAAQIFKYLPQALSFAGGFKIDKVMVSMLVPYDTRQKWGYVTTIAKVYYPEALVDTLKMDLLEPNSDLYHHAKALVNDLTADINPNIDLWGHIIDDDGDNKGDDKSGNNSNNDAIDSGDNSGSSSKQQATTAGIAVGALGLSVMYGAAMFIVARRYKRKRQGHRRASSISGSEASSEMQYGGTGSPAMMGGALLSQDASNYGGAGGRDSHGSGNNSSARTANISAPVATENSLGWN